MVKAFDLQAYLNNGFSYYKSHPQQLKTELLSGITLALIEVPEAIVFAFMAGLDPYYGLASVFWIGTLTGLFGGRPAMVSGAAGAMAVVMGDLTRDDGPLKTFPRQARVEQLLMTVVLIGILEVFCAPLLCAFIKIIPSSAMIGFMNACVYLDTRVCVYLYMYPQFSHIELMDKRRIHPIHSFLQTGHHLSQRPSGRLQNLYLGRHVFQRLCA